MVAHSFNRSLRKGDIDRHIDQGKVFFIPEVEWIFAQKQPLIFIQSSHPFAVKAATHFHETSHCIQ